MNKCSVCHLPSLFSVCIGCKNLQRMERENRQLKYECKYCGCPLDSNYQKDVCGLCFLDKQILTSGRVLSGLAEDINKALEVMQAEAILKTPKKED